MKIDRVLLTLNNNKIYTKFWNIVAPIWKNKFKIKPTLIFIGSEDEFKSNNFENLEDYIILNKVEEVFRSYPDWSVTWGVMYGASKFPNDVCITCGIDQIPLNYSFFDAIKNIEDDKYIIGFSDGYIGYTKNTLSYFNTKTNKLYPSSHHVAKGYLYKEIYNIEDDWELEIKKVYNSRGDYYLPNSLWGLDECYSSDKIENYNNKNKIVFLDYYKNDYGKTRLVDVKDVNMELVRDEYYTEFTCKTYNDDYILINNIIQNIKEYN